MQGMPTTQERLQKRPCIHRCGPAADEEAVPPVAAGRLRKAESGPGWRELFLSERCDAGATPSAAAAVAAGHSLLQFDVLASASECGALLSEAAALAAAVRAEHFGEDRVGEEEGGEDSDWCCGLPPAHCLMLSNAARIRMPVDEMLGDAGRKTCDAVLMRAMRALEAAQPALSHGLFPDSFSGTGRRARTCLGNKRLVFAAGEPAINVYTPGGCFVPHEDGQSLSVLVNLSHPDDFDGGGTAFWALKKAGRDSEGRVVDANPTVTLRLPAGTALVFGGQVTHSGQMVTRGQRTVLVASFSEDTRQR